MQDLDLISRLERKRRSVRVWDLLTVHEHLDERTNPPGLVPETVAELRVPGLEVIDETPHRSGGGTESSVRHETAEHGVYVDLGHEPHGRARTATSAPLLRLARASLRSMPTAYDEGKKGKEGVDPRSSGSP